MLIAGGFDGDMYLFQRKSDHWQLTQTIQGKAVPISLSMMGCFHTYDSNACTIVG